MRISGKKIDKRDINSDKRSLFSCKRWFSKVEIVVGRINGAIYRRHRQLQQIRLAGTFPDDDEHRIWVRSPPGGAVP